MHMKKALLGILLFSLIPATQNVISAQSKLSHGQYVNVRIDESFSSRNATTASAFVDNDVIDPTSGKLLIAKGTPVNINVTAEKPKGKGRPGKITLNALSTQATDGQTIVLTGNKVEITGKSRRGLALGLGIGLPLGTVVCFPWGFACLAIKGLHAEVPSGTIIPNVTVQGNYTISNK